ncbi:MurR/RpiR family transcriptional regulator [Pseudorhodobacter sp.]|uniref:MurR/RpiR family transcriptional regulator n=1 Tax=Pseudorhodobacter sp. TaxID=1934400 RepID=UPI0026476D08|nr:MurR/RpiR family transcriptional regulator [Pseudorhodobacter sp.]MDN5788726.1 MurR/RpiR family transcriptional regulator [Pseudorhodobacter sp.]
MTSDFLVRLSQSADRLTETDQKMVSALLDRREELVFLSGPQLAERIEVHGAAPTRLAQKLGYKGFPELRSVLQKDMLNAQDAALRMRRSVNSAEEGHYLSDLVAFEITALQNLDDLIPQSAIDQVADAIFGARNVFIFAQGHAQSIAHFLSRRLDRFGLTTVSLTGRGRDVAERLVGLTKDDVVIALAFRKQPSTYTPMMQHVRDIGATSILVSDLAGLIMTPEPDITLAAPRGRSGSEFQTPTVPFVIISAILLTMAARHEEAAIGALEKLSKLFDGFEKP